MYVISVALNKNFVVKFMAEKDTLEILQRVVFGVVATLVLTYGEQKVVLSLIVDEQKIVLI